MKDNNRQPPSHTNIFRYIYITNIYIYIYWQLHFDLFKNYVSNNDKLINNSFMLLHNFQNDK